MIFFKTRTLLIGTIFLFSALSSTNRVVAQSADQSVDQTQQYFEISKNLEILTNLFKELSQSYVNSIQPGKMTKEGITAMLSGLDPYTNFFTEADAENFRIQSQGQYGGIGILTKIMDSSLVVYQVFESSPADKAGIHIGDILIAANDQSLEGKSVDELAVLMRGDQGTLLSLTVRNPVTGKESKLKITRTAISISDVPYAGLMGKEQNIAYVRLTQFMGPASEGIKESLDSLKNVQPALKGVILDLRGNPGGLLKEAVRTCNLFLPEGQTVVTTKGKNAAWQKVFQTTGQPWNTEIPVAVLVNHHSASASEIVAGTMQDLDRGVIIGTRSFGKGLVQEVKPLGYNTSLKLTVAHYYTPSGRCIQALDYAHRNVDGSVSKIPDSLQNSFKTRNGRIVKDGGGIAPDIFIPEEETDAVLQTLIGKNYIFNYATKYFYSHPTIAPAKNFHLTKNDFTDFTKWLSRQDFNAQTNEVLLLNKFKIQAENNQQFAALKMQYDALINQLEATNELALDQDKTVILNLLGNEISGRYYYQKGKALNKLSQDDPALKRALEVLGNNKEYKEILKNE